MGEGEATGATDTSAAPAASAGKGRGAGFGLFLMVLGAGLGGLGLHSLRLGWATRSWPLVAAEIVDAKLTIRTDATGSGTPRIGVVSGGNRDEFAAYATSFRYTVDGVTHIAHGVERGDLGIQNSAKSQDLAFAHPVGSRTAVAVNPADAGEAYLVAGPSSTAKLLCGLGAAFLLVGLAVRRASRRSAATGGGRAAT